VAHEKSEDLLQKIADLEQQAQKDATTIADLRTAHANAQANYVATDELQRGCSEQIELLADMNAKLKGELEEANNMIRLQENKIFYLGVQAEAAVAGHEEQISSLSTSMAKALNLKISEDTD